jgi:hypothetical protein
MTDEFDFDVFLSHSQKDKDVVRPIAERLQSDGLRVWFDEWEIKPGNFIPKSIQNGLERSRCLVLCMSFNVSASEWSQFERGVFLFRDPTNEERRFIPIRLDDAPVRDSVVPFANIRLFGQDFEREYRKLHEACRPPGSRPAAEGQGDQAMAEARDLQLGHASGINSLALCPDARQVIAGSDDGFVRVWDLETGARLRLLVGHSGAVWGVAISGDGRRALSGSDDGAVRVWDLGTGSCLRRLEGHYFPVRAVAWSADDDLALSGSANNAIQVWSLRDLLIHATPLPNERAAPNG